MMTQNEAIKAWNELQLDRNSRSFSMFTLGAGYDIYIHPLNEAEAIVQAATFLREWADAIEKKE